MVMIISVSMATCHGHMDKVVLMGLNYLCPSPSSQRNLSGKETGNFTAPHGDHHARKGDQRQQEEDLAASWSVVGALRRVKRYGHISEDWQQRTSQDVRFTEVCKANFGQREFQTPTLDKGNFEGSRPEWCISTIYHA